MRFWICHSCCKTNTSPKKHCNFGGLFIHRKMTGLGNHSISIFLELVLAGESKCGNPWYERPMRHSDDASGAEAKSNRV